MSFVGFKDRVPECLHPQVVYKYSCSSFNSTYVGMTNLHLQTRVCKHVGILPFTVSNVKTSYIVYGHFILIGYEISFNDFTILRSVPDK